MNLAQGFGGLSDEKVIKNREEFGANTMPTASRGSFLFLLKEVILEPMFLLLLAACVIYFALGSIEEALIMLLSIFLVAGISIFQEYRSRNAVNALRKIAAAKCSVIRNGVEVKITPEEIVKGDLLLVTEGEVVAADGILIQANDLAINESILTGESFAVIKKSDGISSVFKGTLAVSGSGYVKVSDVGIHTAFGKIGTSLQEINTQKTPLELQIRSFVKNMVWIGGVAFALVVAFNYYLTADIIQSFLQGLTLAMSILPEEIPVAFSTFQALGAFRLLKNNIIVKQPKYVETLGAATVICADKTGTITQNKMSIYYLYDALTQQSIKVDETSEMPVSLLEYAMWSSETNPFDPMEVAIHQCYEKTTQIDKRKAYKQIHEYPIGGTPPMMTHIFQGPTGDIIIAAKGADEALLQQSAATAIEKEKINSQAKKYAAMGLRVLAIGKGKWEGTLWPATQQQVEMEVLGLIAFQDPPKNNIAETIMQFTHAGIPFKMITGDHIETAIAIASQVKLVHHNKVLTGKEVMEMSDELLRKQVIHINIFARMFPDAKLKVINALKANGEIVAMTGDGVNDAPALKAAHIGIAMGKRGSEVAKSAASLILTDDDLSHMVDAVALGRKIYDNLQKAIQYIVSIHIPIILIVVLPLLLGWVFTDIFSPVHVIFLELIMGPTCSIMYENEPMEKGTMQRVPRLMGNTFLSFFQLWVSIVQGLVITAGCLGIGYYFLQQGADDTLVRSVIFITLLFSNVFLTLVNRSFKFSIFTTIRYRNNLVPLIIGISLLFIAAILLVPFLSQLFELQHLTFSELLYCIVVAFVATIWIELVKQFRFNKILITTHE
ncbi:MAG: cation-translocating P-type ATPase [Ferruginibacter sp.]